MKHVCSTFDEYKKRSNDLVKRFEEKGYKENIIWSQIEKVGSLERSTLLNKTDEIPKNIVPFLVTYRPTLLIIKEIINNHWHILNINQNVPQKHVLKTNHLYKYNQRQPKTSED